MAYSRNFEQDTRNPYILGLKDIEAALLITNESRSHINRTIGTILQNYTIPESEGKDVFLRDDNAKIDEIFNSVEEAYNNTMEINQSVD